LKGEWRNEFLIKGRIDWDDGSYQEGKFVRLRLNGTGVQKYKDGRIYKGEFFNGHHSGKGTLI